MREDDEDVLYLKNVRFASLAKMHCRCLRSIFRMRREAVEMRGVITTRVSKPGAMNTP